MNEILLGVIAAILGAEFVSKRLNKTPSTDESGEVSDYTVSVPYGAIFAKYSRKYNVPLRLMVAISDWETIGTFDPKIINSEKAADIKRGYNVDSVGLGQILYPDTAVALDSSATIAKLQDPDYNLNLMGMLLNQLRQRYPQKESDGFPPNVVAAYNAGSAKHKTSGEYVNQTYVDGVRSKWAKWRHL
jgi:soluble lytic murein transglycosylase-like protein